MQKRLFWWFRNKILNIKFVGTRFLYGRKEGIREVKTRTVITGLILKEIWRPALVSILVVIILEIFRYFLPRQLTITQDLASTYDTFLGTTAGIAGVFLGLYFTGLSVVAGSVFPQVPVSVRGVILKNKVSNLYVRSLALLTAIAVLLLGIRILGIPPNFLGAAVVTSLAFFGIFSFIVLGFGVFNLFDPASLANIISNDIYYNIHSVTVNGFAWENTNFQFYHQKQTKINLDALNALIEVCRGQEQLALEPLAKISNVCCHIFYSYQSSKRLIPLKSRWYELTPKYKNWFLASSSEMDIAMKTQTMIQPEMIPNHFWFEERIVEIIKKSIGFLLEQKNTRVTYEILESFCNSLSSLGSNLNVTESLNFLDLVFRPVEDYLKSQTVEVLEDKLDDGPNLGLLDLKT